VPPDVAPFPGAACLRWLGKSTHRGASPTRQPSASIGVGWSGARFPRKSRGARSAQTPQTCAGKLRRAAANPFSRGFAVKVLPGRSRDSEGAGRIDKGNVYLNGRASRRPPRRASPRPQDALYQEKLIKGIDCTGAVLTSGFFSYACTPCSGTSPSSAAANRDCESPGRPTARRGSLPKRLALSTGRASR